MRTHFQRTVKRQYLFPLGENKVRMSGFPFVEKEWLPLSNLFINILLEVKRVEFVPGTTMIIMVL